MLTVKWRTLISREVTGSFESFSSANWRIGVEAAQSFSKIKLPGSSQTITQASAKRRKSGLVSIAAIAKALWARPRVLIHGAVALSLIGVILGSSLNNTGVASLKLSTQGVGSSLDHISTATVASEVAQKTDFMVADQAAKQTETLSSQVTLPTVDDTVLAKHQIVETAGSERRTIRTYSVGAGETLSGIAARFGVTTSTIKWANDLSAVDELKPGQELTILPVSGVLYTVQAGDTADGIANKFEANAAQIISFNNAEVKGLKAGQKIVVPDGVKAEVRVAARTTNYGRTTAPALTAYFGAGNGYDYGYCTWYVANKRPVPSNWGNASSWYYNAQFSGFKVGSAPAVGAIAWTGGGYAGHVAYVEAVNGDSVTVSEMNYAGWNVVSWRTVPASSFRYIY